MKEKILVNVVIPKIEKSYDLFIPISKNIYITMNLLIKAINELEENFLPVNNTYKLLDSNGNVLDEYKSIKESNIKNGDSIILI